MRTSLAASYGHFIDGMWSPPAGGGEIEVSNPADGSLLTVVARGLRDDVDRAVSSADRAFRDTAWSGLKPVERGRLLLRLAKLLLGEVDRIALAETLDNGKPLSQSRENVRTAARYFEYYGGYADKVEGSVIPQGAGQLAFSVYEPFGVTAHIVPWNAPLVQAARGSAPALAVGNTVVLKPAEEAPVTCLLLAELAAAAGLPAGVVNVVTGYGAEAGEALASHPGVRKITFTGSLETGRRVMAVAAQGIVPVGLELGGKSPCLVFRDGDIQAAVSALRATVTRNTGQVCSAATRFYVQGEVMAPFLDAARDALHGLRLGPGVEDPDVGPLISEAQLDRVHGYVDAAEEQGARVIDGGERVLDDPGLSDGFFYRPTILENVGADWPVMREEVFGPVVCVHPFDDETEALALANASTFGLAAGVFTADVDRALRVAAALEAGQVFVNEYHAGGVETPFGGYKQSGIGREKGLQAIAHYAQLKTVVVRRREQPDRNG